jgi:hypothetical protein
MVFVKVYYNMDNLKIDNVNVEYDHLNPTKSFGVDTIMLMPPSIKKPSSLCITSTLKTTPTLSMAKHAKDF